MSGSTGELSPLSVLGFTAAQEELYRVVLRNSGASPAEIARLLALPAKGVREGLGRMAALGLVELRGDAVVALPPAQALLRLISEENRRLRSVAEQLESLRQLLPSLSAEHLSSQAPKGDPVTVELLDNSEVIDLIRVVAPNSSGDLLWLRPDQWRYPDGPVADAWVKEMVRAGRRSRAIYPARVLEEAPEVVRDRSEAGEHVRILADVPFRLAILGDAAVVVANRLDGEPVHALVVREKLMMTAARFLFDILWDKAMAVPGLDGRRHDAGASDRSMLLDQLAGGAKDEQIARALGLSLRTVRRRVSEVLDELGADSRFQAGVEAVRRGWL